MRRLIVFASLLGLTNALSLADTITWGGDNSRSGYQTGHNLDPAVVRSSQFGQLYRTLLPGSYLGVPEQIFSQPLVFTPGNETRQFLYVATTQNNVYKLDAKTGQILASRNLGIPFLTAELDGCVDINPTIGITGTGVIDAESDTLYLTSKTYINQNILEKVQGRPAGRYYVHALNIHDLTDRPGFPVGLEGLVARNSPSRIFSGGIHLQRPALLLTGQYVYAAFGSHCVQYLFSGWIVGFDKTTGNIVERWATEGKGVPQDIKGGGIWMSGGGIASDDAGSVFFSTGNGYASQLSTIPVQGFNPPTAIEEAAVHMTQSSNGSLDIVDFFMPANKEALDAADKDLGTSPLQMLPSQFACGSYRRIGVITGKTGMTYWLNMDNLGGYRQAKNGLGDDVIQTYQHENSVYAGAGVYPLEGGYCYINVVGYPTSVFKFSCNNGVPAFTKVATSPIVNAGILGVSHGTTTSLNNQEGTGLLWVTDVQGLGLKIYKTVPQDGSLVMINSFNVVGVTKFTRPVFGDKLCFVGTTLGYIYAFGSPVTSPLNCTSGVDFGSADVASNGSIKSITCTANIDVTVTEIGLGQVKDFRIEAVPKLPLSLSQGQSLSVSSQFVPKSVGFLSVDMIVNTTNSVPGYSTETHARMSGTGTSATALLSLSPKSITFEGVVTGQNPSGVTETLVIANKGGTILDIRSVLATPGNSSGPSVAWSGQGDLVIGPFTLQNIPATVAPNSGAVVSVMFNSSVSGTFSAYANFISSGGNATVSLVGSSGPAAVAVLEFQTPDGQNWVKYTPGLPFSFGNVLENTYKSLTFRVTNGSPKGGVKLSLTVSKPPFGVAGIVRAANQVDLAEGTALNPGESATAILTCSIPKSQWNVDTYNGTSTWTMNTNDPTLGKQVIHFFCNATAEQAPPILASGQGQYRYIGCFKDNTPNRQLPDLILADEKLTNAKCIAAGAKGKYAFCGTQYLSECWAGSQIPAQKVDDEQCNYSCSGALDQICGGNGRGDGAGGAYMSVFVDPFQWDGNFTRPSGPKVNPGALGFLSIGCYTEPSQARALPNGVNTEKKTVAACVAACKGAGYSYAGVEYGGECWCGNALNAASVHAPDTDCAMACNGEVAPVSC